jgi:putative NADH-flavin reductase
MQVATFGITGRAGSEILRQCRTAGHQVHALARRPGTLGEADDGVTVAAGDVRDAVAAGQVVAGAGAVISAIGGTQPGNLAVLEQGTAAIITAMRQHGVRRLIVIQGFHLPFPGDPGHVGQPLMSAVMHVWKRHLHADTYRMAELLRACDLDWTLIRMPRLTADPAQDGYRVGHLALGPWSKVTAGQVGHFTLTCLTDGSYVRAAPMIASGRPYSRTWRPGRRQVREDAEVSRRARG